MEKCDDNRLSLYIDNMLSDDETKEISEHLQNCDECRAIYEELMKIKAELEKFKEVDLPDGFHEETMSKIRGKFINKVRIPQARHYGTVAAGLLLTVILFGGIGGIVNSSLNTGSNIVMEEAGKSATFGGTATAGTYMSEAAAGIPAVASQAAAAAPAAESETAPEIMYNADTKTASVDKQSQNDMGRIMLNEPAWAFRGNRDQSVKNYNIVLRVEDFEAALSVIEDMPGYNISSDTQSYEGAYEKWASMQRAVEAQDYEQIKFELKKLGKLMSEYESETRIYNDLDDLQVRINTKEKELSRLFELLERSDSVNAMVAIERRLEAVSQERDNLRSSYMSYTNNSGTPKINIDIRSTPDLPVYKDTVTFGEKLKISFIASVNGTLELMQNIAVIISYISVPFIVLCFVVFIVFLVINTAKRRRNHDE